MFLKLTCCKLGENYRKKLHEFFVLEVTAQSAADLLEIRPNSAALFYHKVRLIISRDVELDAREMFDGQIELDESYFGGRRKGKCGRGAAGTVIVFCILKRGGRV